MTGQYEAWPPLPLDAWQDSCETLHLWTQIIGKIRMAQKPWINHSWHVPLYVSARGLTTSIIPYGERTFEIIFDFIDHRLCIEPSEGGACCFDLQPMSVADFYHRVMQALDELDIVVQIHTKPVEMPDPVIAFPQDDRPGAYDTDAVERFWRILLQVHRVFTDFRAGFVGKVSPVHFFWGAFDLAVTRFSGRTAPKHPGGIPNCPDWVMQEAYSHEVSSAGFWPGTGLGEAAFYSYAWPEPDGYREYPVRPQQAYYLKEMGEYILPYDAIRSSDDPGALLMEFLQTTYQAAAELAGWERDALEQKPERTGV